MSSENNSSQQKPEWEMPSMATVPRNGNFGPGLRSSNTLTSPTSRVVPSNGPTQPSKHLSSTQHVTLSSTNSMASSRDTSPNRLHPLSLNSVSTSRSASRSRKNSQELGPTRTSSTTSIGHTSIPIVLDIPGGPFDSKKPHIPPPSSNNSADISVMPTKSGDPPLQWPRLNRIKSPPPALSPRTPLQRTTSPKRTELESATANTSSKRCPVGNDVILLPDKYVDPSDDFPIQNPPRNLGRGGAPALETVQEGTVPKLSSSNQLTDEDYREVARKSKPAGDSGSDSNKSSGSKTDQTEKGSSTNLKSDEILAKRSFTSLSSARGKLGETSMTNMTVETEIVSTIPQVSLAGVGDRGAGRKDGGTMLRVRASDETIRPKKEKKRTRKLNLPPGTVSSKADIFEAKVASAVEDADSSDSAETFVYESNPPDPHPARQHRYHSRTPSAASTVGQFEQYGSRLRPGVREAIHGITGKRSMKFTNTSYNTMDGEGDDRSVGRGSSRGTGHMHTARHYHIGRHGRNGTHQPVLDQSPFQSSHSPKSGRGFFRNGNGRDFKKDGDTYGYDFDAEGADDERAPLVGGIRATRSRHGRRSNGMNPRQVEYLGQRQPGFCARYGICALLSIIFFILTGGSTLFVIGATQPLKNVHVREIQNVLASEQTMMLDLDIAAINPNIFVLSISDLDVNIFAKSRYVGNDAFWRDRGPHPDDLPRTEVSKKRAIMARGVERSRRSQNSHISLNPTVNVTGGVDKGTDPMPDDDLNGDPQTMLLGRIFQFASPLVFEPSPWRQTVSNSTGQLRLAKPGNKTEEGGSLRWERVLQHPFELIVRGVVKYQLPLSTRTRSASISSKINVLPEDDGNNGHEGDGDGKDDNKDIPNDSVHIQ